MERRWRLRGGSVGCTAALVAGAAMVVLAMCAVLAAYFARHYYIAAKIAAVEPLHGDVYRDDNVRLQSGRVPIVVMFGDSRVRAWSPLPSVGRCSVVNRGIGGETTAQMVHRFKMDAVDLAPRALVIQGGINDIVAASLAGASAGKHVRNTVANLKWMIGRARQAGIPVLLLTVIPPSKPSLFRRLVWSGEIEGFVEDVNRDLMSLHAPPMVRVIDTASVLPSEDGRLKRRVTSSELHLNAQGYLLLNAAVEAVEPCG